MDRRCFRPRPLKVWWRLKTVGSHPNFRVPFVGIWSTYSVAGGSGSGATHVDYASASERGGNGDYKLHTVFMKSLSSTVYVGDFGAGGALTNNSDIPAQQGEDGEDTVSGNPLSGTTLAGEGGRCAFESASLVSTQLAAPYLSSASSVTGNPKTGALLGVIQDGGNVRVDAGRGAAGRPSPPPAQAGINGVAGEVDYYSKG